MHKINGSGRDVLSDQCRNYEQQICSGAMGVVAGVAVDVMNAPSTTAVVLASAGRLQFKFAVHKF